MDHHKDPRDYYQRLLRSGFGWGERWGGDVHALMECCNDVEGRELHLLLNSPGGTPEAAEQILNYLRTQFDHIR